MSHKATFRPADELTRLLQRCARGDEQAFAEFYDATAERAYGVALRVLRDPGMAEDATQEAYLDLWRHAPRYNPDKGSPAAFLLTLVHRRAVDRVRKTRATARRDETYLRRAHAGADGDTTSVTALAALEGQRVRAALAFLTPQQRLSVSLAYFDGLTHREVAAVVGAPLGTVKSRIRVGLLKLRKALETVDSAAI